MPTLEPGRVLLRSATAAEWTSRDPILGMGELGLELQTDGSPAKIKLGDGSTKWADLPYFTGPVGPIGDPGPPGQDGALSLALADASLVNTGTATNPILAVGDLSGTYADAAALAGLSAQQAQLMDVAATIDELTVEAQWVGGWDGTTWGKALAAIVLLPIWIAPYACQVTAAQLINDADVALDATNYVGLQLRRSTSVSDLATIVTQNTSDLAIVKRVAWSFAGATWDTAAAVLAPGDSLGLVVIPHGTAVLTCPVAVTLTVQPT